jgi:hypothetical protein
MTRELEVYNLEFEWPDEKMEIGRYTFIPKEDYLARYKQLSRAFAFSRQPYGAVPECNGTHIATGIVVLPEEERPPVLKWRHPDATELDDILLLLSLFTQRRVLVFEEEDTQGIIADPREFHYGGTLALSLPQTKRGSALETEYAQAIASGVAEVNERIRTDAWQCKYQGGYFLFLFFSACHRHIVETSFLLCWTIWEHLFRLHNEHWVSTKILKDINVRGKIRFILTEYGLREKISKQDEKSVNRLTLIRHRLSHDGTFAESDDVKAAVLFIRLTEFVIAKILGLEPSDVFSQRERLDRFGRGELL